MRRPYSLLVFLVVGVLVDGAVGSPAFGQPASTASSADTIRAWIEQLASPQFSQREEASRGLAAAGADAVAPLAAAAIGPDLEASSRAIEILGGFMAADEPRLAAAAEKAIESLVDGPDGPAQQMSRAALDFHNVGLSKESMERIESLGGRILPMGQGGFQVLINSSWRGTADDFRHLSRLRGAVHVSIHGVKLDSAVPRFLARLRGVQRLELYGTGLSDDAVATLQRSFPEARVDVRRGGKLGVGGQPMVGQCLINHIEDGSAAAEAGLAVGDIVLEINGEPVASFDELTSTVGQHGAGETIDLKIQRGDSQMVRRVKLGGWR